MRIQRRDNILTTGSGLLVTIKGGSSFDPRPFLAEAHDQTSVLHHRKDQIIFSQDDPAEAVFYVEQGVLKVTVHSRQGKKAVVALVGPGDFVGEECLAGRTQHMGTAAMITAGSVVRIEKATMLHLLRTQPRFSELFISDLMGEKFRVVEDLADQLLNTSEKRLARRLLLLAHSGDDSIPKITFRINQDTIAAMIGTTQARVSFFMNKFRRSGFIKYNGNLTVDRSLSAFVQE
jgi:CRP-like cAMP-binding protein